MLTVAQAPLNICAVAEAVFAFGAMATNAVLAQAALIAGRAGTGATVRTVLRVIINTLIAQFMLFATTIEKICVFTIDDETNPAFLAGHLYAIYAMLPSNIAGTLLSSVVAKMFSTVKAMTCKTIITFKRRQARFTHATIMKFFHTSKTGGFIYTSFTLLTVVEYTTTCIYV